MKRFKVIIFVKDLLSGEITADLDYIYSDDATHSNLFAIAEQYYSKCSNRCVTGVRVIDNLKISITF